MNRFHRWCCLLLISLISMTVSAQEWMPDPCAPAYPLDEISAAACTAYSECITDTPASECKITTVVEAHETCVSAGRDQCEIEAVIRTNLALLFFNTLTPEGRLVAADLLNTYFQHDSLVIMGNVYGWMRSQAPINHMLSIVYGILESSEGRPEIAVEHYTQSIQRQSNNPLAHYFRMQAYLQLGDEALAARDAHLYRAQASDELKAAFDTPEIDFTPDEPEAWIAYPVVRVAISPVGIRIFDLTMQDAQSVTLALLDDQTLALTSLDAQTPDQFEFLSRIDTTTPSDPKFDFAIQPDATQYGLARNSEPDDMGYCGEGGALILTQHEGYFIYERVSYGQESGGETKGILLPADAPDPRESLPRVCEGLPTSYVQVDDPLAPLSGMQGILIYPEMSFEGEFILTTSNQSVVAVEGPFCTADAIWWRVLYNGDAESGWVAEAEGTEYTLSPADFRIPTEVEAVLGLSSNP